MVTYVEDYFFDYGYDYYTGYKYRDYDVTVGGLRYNLEIKTNEIVKVKVRLEIGGYIKNHVFTCIFHMVKDNVVLLTDI